MRIIIDGDGTPSVAKIEELAQAYSIPVIIYCDYAHEIKSDYATVIISDVGNQNVDIKISNEIKKCDLLVTQDYGLAVVALGKKALAINPSGFIYDSFKIDQMMEERHMKSKARRGGAKFKGPKKRTSLDENNLINNIEKIIKENL